MKRHSLHMLLGALACLVFSSVLTGCSGISPVSQSGGNAGGGPSGTLPSKAEFVYSIVGSSLSGFSLGADGKLQPISTVSPGGILNTRRLVISPDAKWLFTVTGCPPSTFLCSGRGEVFSQSIGPDGKLGNPQTVIPADQLNDGLIVDAQSHFVYALTEVIGVGPIDPSTGCQAIQQTLTAYGLTSDGQLSPINSNVKTVDSGSCPDTSTSTVTKLVGFSQGSSGTFLWLTQTVMARGVDNASLLSIPIASDGTLGMLKANPIPFVPGQDFTVTLADRSVIAGGYLVTAQDTGEAFDNTVTTFRLSNGDAEFATQCPASVPACHFVAAIAASPDGKFIYTLSQPSSSWQVNSLTLDPASGILTPIVNPVVLPQNAIGMATLDEDQWPPLLSADSQQRFLLVARSGDGIITTINIVPGSGVLGAAMDSPVGGTPNAIKAVIK